MTTMQERADRLVRNEVNVCLSSLVATLAGGVGAVRALPGWRHTGAGSLDELCNQAFELCSPVLDYEEAAMQAGWTLKDGGWSHPVNAGEYEKGAEDLLCDENSLEPYEYEIFEHWSVSQALHDDLAALGERVDNDFAGMCVWGRTTTGQGIAQDSIIRRVLEMHDARYKAIIEERETV